MSKVSCIYCGRGFHDECPKCRAGECHPNSETDDPTASVRIEEEEPDAVAFIVNQPRELRDAESTGRKRAAKLYPIDEDNPGPCDWKGQKDCGGGRFPIIGCYQGVQQHRHHGPVKETINNKAGNVHRICTSCHVRWHELNDVPYVVEDYRLLPHMPVPATDLEVIQYDLDWKSGKIAEQFTLKSSTEGLAARKVSSD